MEGYELRLRVKTVFSDLGMFLKLEGASLENNPQLLTRNL